MSASRKNKPDFETALRELEAVVERLEEGDMPLEQAVKEWEKGMKLRDSCQKILKQAEQKVDVLMRKSEGYDALPLDRDE